MLSTCCLLSATGALRAPAVMMKVGTNAAAARAQERAYFELAPWEKKPELIKNQRLDLRAFIQPFNRDRCVLATVVATQEGRLKPRKGQSPIAKLDNADGGPWRTVGVIAAPDEESLSAAVELQRDLIEAWAVELIRDFKTDAKLLSRTRFGSPPIRLAWVTKAGPLQFDWPRGCINEVPINTRADKGLRCGFVGSQCRSVKGDKGGFRFEPVTLPP